MIRWSRLTSYAVGLLIPAVLACSSDRSDHNNFREDVFQCEEAVSHLSACCPEFDHRSVACKYDYTGSCDSGMEPMPTLPELSLEQSNCIMHTSCADLVAHETCRTMDCRGAR
jgi:hypothetical protein